MASIKSIYVLLVNILASIQFASVMGKTIVPPGCDEKQLCFEKPENYPQEAIDEYFRENGVSFTSAYDKVDMRISEDNIDDGMNCVTKVTHDKPFKFDGKFIIQSPYFTQTIKRVYCKDYGSSCWNDFVSNTIYSTTCETKQGELEVIIFDEELKKPVSMPVPVDVCCTCTIRDRRKML